MVGKRNEIDGDLVIPGSLVVMGGFQNSSYSRTVTRLSGTEQAVTVIQGEIIDRPTYEETARQGFETRYTRSNTTPATPTGDNPAGWTITVPSGSDAIWMSGAVRNFDGTIAGAWYAPVRFTGAATVFAQLSNDRQTIPCDADGNNGNYTGAFSDMSVFEGAVDVTSLCTFGETHSTGVTGTLAGNRFTLTLLTVDAAYIDIVATRSGMDPLTKRFSVSRTRIGDSTPLYRMTVSTTIVKLYPDGSINPTEILFESSASIGLSTPTPYPGIFKYYINEILQFTSPTPQATLVWNNARLYPSDTLYPSTTLYPPVILSDLEGDVNIMRCELWSDDATIMLDSQTVAFLKDVLFELDDILEAVPDYTPKYLGKFHDELPPAYRRGDWFLVYGTGTPYTRGVYVVSQSGTATRITGASSADSTYMSTAMADILAVTNEAGNGVLSDYGAITFISNLVANTAFIQQLMVQTLTLQNNGKIKSNNFDATHGFELDGTTGNLTARNVNISGAINASSGSFNGTVNATGGSFSGSLDSSGATFDKLRVTNGFEHYLTDGYYTMGYVRGYVKFQYNANAGVVQILRSLNLTSVVLNTSARFSVNWSNYEVASYSVASVTCALYRTAWIDRVPIPAIAEPSSTKQQIIYFGIGTSRLTSFVAGDDIIVEVINISKD